MMVRCLKNRELIDCLDPPRKLAAQVIMYFRTHAMLKSIETRHAKNGDLQAVVEIQS